MFEEAEWRGRIEALPDAQRRAFTAAIATRQVVSLERLSERTFNIADRLWQGIGLELLSNRAIWIGRIATLPKMVPNCEGFRQCSPYVRMALATLGYAMMCRLSCKASDVLKAATCAINAAKMAETHITHLETVAQRRVRAAGYSLCQREIDHQESDLKLLAMGWLGEISWQSYSNPMLSENDAAIMATAA